MIIKRLTVRLRTARHSDSGVLPLIRHNLTLTPTERVRQTATAAVRERQKADGVARLDRPCSLEQICSAFHIAGIEFIIVGGQAESLMGGCRPTSDVDLIYRRTEENLGRLACVLATMNPALCGGPPTLSCSIDTLLSERLNLELLTDFGRLDLLGWMKPLGGYEELIVKAGRMELQGIPVRVVNIDDMICIQESSRKAKFRKSLFQWRTIRGLRKPAGHRLL